MFDEKDAVRPDPELTMTLDEACIYIDDNFYLAEPYLEIKKLKILPKRLADGMDRARLARRGTTYQSLVAIVVYLSHATVCPCFS